MIQWSPWPSKTIVDSRLWIPFCSILINRFELKPKKNNSRNRECYRMTAWPIKRNRTLDAFEIMEQHRYKWEGNINLNVWCITIYHNWFGYVQQYALYAQRIKLNWWLNERKKGKISNWIPPERTFSELMLLSSLWWPAALIWKKN